MKVINYSEIKSIDSNCGKVRESFTNNIGLARVEMSSGISPAHYHNNTTEYYLILSGTGILKIKSPEGEINEVELKPGIILQIDPKEIHQTNNLGSLVLEAITSPAWTAEDEFIVEESLFSE